MTVPAHSVKDLTFSVNSELVDMRGGRPVRAGTFAYEGEDVVTGWHHHDLHQLEYALAGVAEVETAEGHYLLPPQQAIWIPAGLRHQTSLRRVRSISVFLAPDLLQGSGDRARILAAAPVIREMIRYGARWPITRPSSDEETDAYFEVLARVVSQWLDHETPLCLPTSRDPIVSSAMTHTRRHLAAVTEEEICTAIGVSERTLRRRFAASTGMSWRRYLLEARLLRGMARLAESNDSVMTISVELGFESVSSFSRSFRRLVGEPPQAYRFRVTQRSPILAGG